MKFFDLNKKQWQWVLLIFVSFVWGASFILMKKGLESFSAMQVGAIRIFIASMVLLPLLIGRLKKFKRKDIKSLLIVGFIGNLIPAFLFAKAQTEVSSSLAGMLNTAFPIVALIIGTILYGTKTPHHKIIGIIIGLIGSVGIVIGDNMDFSGQHNSYALYIFLAIIFYAISLNEMKYKLPELDGISITVFAFTAIGPFAGAYLIFSDFSQALASPDHIENLLYIALLGIGGSALAVTLFYILVDYVDVIFASLITYIIPIFAIFWGLSDGESLSITQVLFMIVIFSGVFLVNMNNKKNKQKNLHN